MKNLLIVSVLISFGFQSGISQNVKASFGGFLIIPDQLTTLEFNKKGGYEYYRLDCWFGIKSIIDSGRYVVQDNILTLKYIKGSDTSGARIPRKLFLTKKRVNKHIEIDGNSTESFVDEKKSILGNKYLILTDQPYHDSLMYFADTRYKDRIVITKRQFHKKRNETYVYSEDTVMYYEKFKPEKFKQRGKRLDNEKYNLAKEIYSIEPEKLKAYEAEIKEQTNSYDYEALYEIIFLDSDDNEVVHKFDFYYNKNELSEETRIFVEKLKMLFEENNTKSS